MKCLTHLISNEMSKYQRKEYDLEEGTQQFGENVIVLFKNISKN